MSILARNVWVEREGERVCLMAGTSLPAWAKGLVTNPAALVEAGVPVESSDEAHDKQSDDAKDAGDSSEANSDATKDAKAVIPPMKGKGSSAAAWAAYAKSQGFEVDADAKASEIREALVEAGVPVE